MRFLIPLVLAVAVIAAAFHFAKPLPGTNFDESFLPKASSVKYIAAGNDATVAGLFWIKGLTELGESYLTGKEYAYLSHVANLSTELDSLIRKIKNHDDYDDFKESLKQKEEAKREKDEKQRLEEEEKQQRLKEEEEARQQQLTEDE